MNHSVDIEGRFIVVEDNGGRSVTNMAEELIKEIEKTYNINHKDFYFIYRDSMGIWDAIIFENYHPKFISLNKRTKEEAKEKFIMLLSLKLNQ